MATECNTTNFTADDSVFVGAPLLLDTWIDLGQQNLSFVTVTMWGYGIPVIGGEGGDVIGGEGGDVLGPE